MQSTISYIAKTNNKTKQKLSQMPDESKAPIIEAETITSWKLVVAYCHARYHVMVMYADQAALAALLLLLLSPLCSCSAAISPSPMSIVGNIVEECSEMSSAYNQVQLTNRNLLLLVLIFAVFAPLIAYSTVE